MENKLNYQKTPWRPSTANSANLIPYGKIRWKSKPSNAISSTIIPEKEELLSTKEWLSKYSLIKLNLIFTSVISTGNCEHTPVSALNNKTMDPRYCDVFPKVEIMGMAKHVYSSLMELSNYQHKLERVLQRYIRRLKWLLKGSRQVFGTILEENVLVVIDLSGSMKEHKDQLDTQFANVMWEQLFKGKKNFNIICFSTTVRCWKNVLVEPSQSNCNDAIEWFQSMECGGSTSILKVLETALSFYEVEAIYFLTDGKPDCSKTAVLRKIANNTMKGHIKIHTIAQQCEESKRSSFLRLLATQTKGRYHEHGSRQKEIKSWIDSSTSNPTFFPSFAGDDLRLLLKEITLAKRYLQQCKDSTCAIENWKT